MRISKRALFASGICIAICGAGQAAAQATPPAAGEETTVLDVVVTARRQAEDAQTVPVTVVALGAEDLKARQVTSLADLTRVAPGIQFVSQGGSGQMNVILRGLAKSPVGEVPNSVITYFGDVPLSASRGTDIPTFDLENVQVLKGPQGTLFGRNSIGGAVLIVPAKPTYEFEGYGRLALGNYDYRNIEGAINIPIMDQKAALRLATEVSLRDGYFKNPRRPQNRASELNRYSIRASLLLDPIEGVRNITVVDAFKADEVPEGVALFSVFPTGLVRTPALAPFYDCHTVNQFNPTPCAGFQPYADIDDALQLVKDLGPRTAPTYEDYFMRRRFWGIQNRTEITVGDVQLNNIISYRHAGFKVLQASTAALGPPGFLRTELVTPQDQFTEEFQLVGKSFDDRLTWVLGAFYVHEIPVDQNYVLGETGAPAAAYSNTFNDRKSKALYGQIGFEIVDNVKLNLGYRHTWDSAKVCVASTPASAGRPTLTNSRCKSRPNPTVVGFKEDAPTYTVGLDWQVTPSVFAYVTHRRSYRVGGVNAPIFSTPATAFLRPYQTFDPETVRDVEIGLKTRWEVGSVQGRFNISAFKAWNRDFQTFKNVLGATGVPPGDPATPALSGSIVFNAGERVFTGGEAELLVQPVPSLTLQANVAYVHQKLTSVGIPADLLARFPLASFPAVAQLSPEWLITLSGRWELPFHPLDGDLVLAADYYRQTSFEVTQQRFPAYDVSNARLEWNNIGRSGVGAAVFVRNIFDQTNATAGGANNPSLGLFSVQYNAPRMYGAEISLRF